jgi:biopolymer transport protein TolR
MAANISHGKGGAKAEINITPLVDVVLVLLIIFMVVSPGDATYIPDAIPKPAQLDDSQLDANDRMVLELSADGAAKLNQKVVEHADFVKTLRMLFEERADKKLFISAEDELPYGEVVGWMGLAKTAGATLMALKLSPTQN